MSHQNKRVLGRFFQEVWGQGNLALIDELFARDWIGHAPPSEFEGPGELKQFIIAQRQAFPDLEVTVEDQIAEGDKVTTRWTARGTHQGEFLGIPPTGKQQSFGGMTLARLANGKIIEGWTNWDGLGLLRHLVALPEIEWSSRQAGERLSIETLSQIRKKIGDEQNEHQSQITKRTTDD